MICLIFQASNFHVTLLIHRSIELAPVTYKTPLENKINEKLESRCVFYFKTKLYKQLLVITVMCTFPDPTPIVLKLPKYFTFYGKVDEFLCIDWWISMFSVICVTCNYCCTIKQTSPKFSLVQINLLISVPNKNHMCTNETDSF